MKNVDENHNQNSRANKRANSRDQLTLNHNRTQLNEKALQNKTVYNTNQNNMMIKTNQSISKLKNFDDHFKSPTKGKTNLRSLLMPSGQKSKNKKLYYRKNKVSRSRNLERTGPQNRSMNQMGRFGKGGFRHGAHSRTNRSVCVGVSKGKRTVTNPSMKSMEVGLVDNQNHRKHHNNLRNYKCKVGKMTVKLGQEADSTKFTRKDIFFKEARPGGGNASKCKPDRSEIGNKQKGHFNHQNNNLREQVLSKTGTDLSQQNGRGVSVKLKNKTHFRPFQVLNNTEKQTKSPINNSQRKIENEASKNISIKNVKSKSRNYWGKEFQKNYFQHKGNQRSVSPVYNQKQKSGLISQTQQYFSNRKNDFKPQTQAVYPNSKFHKSSISNRVFGKIISFDLQKWIWHTN